MVLFLRKLTHLADVLKSLAVVLVSVSRALGLQRRNSDHGGRFGMVFAPRLLYIISRRRPRRYAEFRRTFTNDPRTQVIRDRRAGFERRQRIISHRMERRAGERRVLNIDGILLRRGWAAVARTD